MNSFSVTTREGNHSCCSIAKMFVFFSLLEDYFILEYIQMNLVWFLSFDLCLIVFPVQCKMISNIRNPDETFSQT